MSLRERKKERTRARLIEVSQDLFAAQGYAATTIDQIATATGISIPTLFVYFESKERLALATEFDTQRHLRARIEDPDRTETTIAIWRAQVETGSANVGRNRARYLRRTQYLSDPALGRGVLDLLTQYEDILAAGIAVDLGVADDAPEARLTATLLSFGNQSAIRRWAAGGGKGDLRALAIEVIDFVESNLSSR